MSAETIARVLRVYWRQHADKEVESAVKEEQTKALDWAVRTTIKDPIKVLSDVLKNLKNLYQYTKPGSREHAMVVSLLQNMQNAELCTLLGCSSSTAAKARAVTKADPTALPGMVDAKEKRTVDRKAEDERPYSELKAEAAAYYKRPENSNVRVWMDAKGVHHTEWVGKKTIEAIFQMYRNDMEAARRAAVSVSMFRECQPTDFKRRRLKACVCRHCKESADIHDRMRDLLRALRSAIKTAESAPPAATAEWWAEREARLRRIVDHIEQEVTGGAVRGTHTLTSGFVDLSVWKQTNPTYEAHRNKSVAQLQKACEENDLPSSKAEREKLIERLVLDRLNVEKHSKVPCFACDSRFELISDVLSKANALTANDKVNFRDGTYDKAGVVRLIREWARDVTAAINHRFEAGRQLKHFDASIVNLKANAEVWCFDFSKAVELNDSAEQTHEQWMSTERATVMGLVQYRRRIASDPPPPDRTLHPNAVRHFNLFVSDDTQHDSVMACACIDIALEDAQRRGITKIYGFSDGGSHFHCSAMLEYLFANAQSRFGIAYDGNFFAPGEGKNDNDRSATLPPSPRPFVRSPLCFNAGRDGGRTDCLG
jgi:hypothetical protein